MTPLRQRMLDALVLRGMAERTQETYIDAVARLARHYRRSPEALTADEVQRYLLHLLRERQLSRSSVNQYGCAFRFSTAACSGSTAMPSRSRSARRRNDCRKSSRATSSHGCSPWPRMRSREPS